jgi:thiamine-phosphate pyrophosphorylase
VAIGGINRDNAAPLVSAGADLVAVISAIWDAPDPKAEALAFARLFEIESMGSR